MKWGLLQFFEGRTSGAAEVRDTNILHLLPPPPAPLQILSIADGEAHAFCFQHTTPFTVATLRGNCGVATINDISRLIPWEWLKQALQALGYTRAVCGVNNSQDRDMLLSNGWTLFSEFTNKRTGNTCYLFQWDLS